MNLRARVFTFTILFFCGLSTVFIPVAYSAKPEDPSSRKSEASGHIVVLKKGVDTKKAATNIANKYNGKIRHVFRYALNGFSVSGLRPESIKSLSSDENIKYIAPNTRVQAIHPPSPFGTRGDISQAGSSDLEDGIHELPEQIVPDNIMRIRVDNAWAQGGGRGIGVAVLDTGIDDDHPDLEANVTDEGVNCVGGNYTDDNAGHGTWVAGIIAAENNEFGVVGVAPESTLFPVKVINSSGQGFTDQFICGLDWIIEYNSGNPDIPIRIANMSFGVSGVDDGKCGFRERDPFHQAICSVRGSDVTLVAAAGNDYGSNFSTLVPAAYDEVITVSALTDTDGMPCRLGPRGAYGEDDHPATFTNRAGSHDQSHTVMAPGYRVIGPRSSTTKYLIGREYTSGTSASAPHVAGLAALIYQRYSDLDLYINPSRILEKLKDFGELPNVNFLGDCEGSQGYSPPSHYDPGDEHPEPEIRADFLWRAPAASISASPRRAHPGEEVILDASESDPAGSEPIDLYYWDCDVNDTRPPLLGSDQSTEVCRYDFPEGFNGSEYTYTASVQVENRIGNISESAYVDIRVVNYPPVAYFTISKRIGRVPLKVDLDAGGSYDRDGGIVSMEWDIDGQRAAEGTPSEVEEISYAFDGPGIHRIKLTVTDDRGAQDTRTKRVWARRCWTC